MHIPMPHSTAFVPLPIQKYNYKGLFDRVDFCHCYPSQLRAQLQ